MKRSSTVVILSVIILVLAVGLVAVLLFMKNQPAPVRGVTPLVEIAQMEADSAKWGLNFPNQYSSLLKTETNNTQTAYAGSNPFSKLEKDPRLLTLFAGYSFSKEYNEDRGHLNSLTDVRAIQRVDENTHATCYSCKSSNNPGLWDEMGMAAYDKMMLSEMTPQIEEPIGRPNCHEANTMKLIVTNPALEEALVAQGKDWRTFTRQEMRTIVCANCHVEYYFKGDDKYLVFPWAKGTRIEQISEFYQDIEFTDWKHPQAGTPMIKMQHPDYELFSADSTHYKAGVACADCHMPYTRDGAAKFSTHNVQSPLLNAETACGACHTDVEYVTGRVSQIQNQVWATMNATEDALVAAIQALEAATATPGVDEALLAEGRNLHREAQLRWDFINAESSMGFHNPEEALRILAESTNLARQAQIKAIEAAGTPAVIQASR
jgi:nitrite reductase (cytochrome c-552)